MGPDTNHDPVRLHQILDGESLAQKLRVADDVEMHPGLAVAFDRFRHLVAGFDRHGAFIHHNFVAGHGAGDFPRDLLDETQIHRPVRQRRSRDGDQDDLRFFNAFGGAGGEAQAARGNVLFHHFFQARLVNGKAAPLQHPHFCGVTIDAHHLVTDLSKASTRHQANIAGPDDRQLHQRFCRLRGIALVRGAGLGASPGFLASNSSSLIPASEPTEP